jgi:hypothetical protein
MLTTHPSLLAGVDNKQKSTGMSGIVLPAVRIGVPALRRSMGMGVSDLAGRHQSATMPAD